MITRTAPQDYFRRKVIIPQEVRMCLHCGGICVSLPRFGVACIDCLGTVWMPVLESKLYLWREFFQAIKATDSTAMESV